MTIGGKPWRRSVLLLRSCRDQWDGLGLRPSCPSPGSHPYSLRWKLGMLRQSHSRTEDRDEMTRPDVGYLNEEVGGDPDVLLPSAPTDSAASFRLYLATMTDDAVDAGLREVVLKIKVVYLASIWLEGLLYGVDAFPHLLSPHLTTRTGVYLCLFMAALPILTRSAISKSFSPRLFLVGNVLIFVLVSINSGQCIISLAQSGITLVSSFDL